jgi:CheY-like chemotaxis protein
MGARILVADDSVTIQKVVELTFSKEDFQLIQARSGEEAIRKAKGERPDLVLLDLVMPDKNGYEVCQALRADPTLRDVPIILLAGTFESFDKERAAAAGANDFVAKPFESQALVSKVKQLLFARILNGAARSGAAASSVAVPPAPATSAPPTEPADAAAAAESPPDQLWQLLDQPATADPPATPRPAAAKAGLDLDAIEASGVDVDLDLDRLAQQAADGAPPAGTDVLTAPGSLSLDDLLGPDATAESAKPASETTPVFELPEEDLPSLPLVEAGDAGTPPDEPAAGAGGLDFALPAPAAEPAPLDAGELDFASLAGDLEPGSVSLPPDGQTSEPVLPSLELALEDTGAVGEPATLEELPPLEAAVAQLGLEPPAPAPVEPQPVEPEASGPEASVPASDDLLAMQHEVAARVAAQLAKELSQKLIERIEHVVWEVVPDLAEILILKEIERIRQLADERKSS